MVAGIVEGLDPGRSTLALDPAVTLASVVWLVGLVGLGLATSIVLFRPRDRYALAWVLVASAVFQSLYGAGELLSGRNQIFAFAKVYHLDSATGTFINRNHYAEYLAAILPFAMGLMMFHAEGLSYRAIASRLGVPIGTVCTWVSRARQSVASALAETER